MNVEINFNPVVTIRWNALEHSMLGELYENDRNSSAFSGECKYTLEEMINLNGRVALAIKNYERNNNEGDWTIPERFHKKDHTNKVPIKELFHKTETIIANMQRARKMTDQFEYNKNSEV